MEGTVSVALEISLFLLRKSESESQSENKAIFYSPVSEFNEFVESDESLEHELVFI